MALQLDKNNPSKALLKSIEDFILKHNDNYYNAIMEDFKNPSEYIQNLLHKENGNIFFILDPLKPNTIRSLLILSYSKEDELFKYNWIDWLILGHPQDFKAMVKTILDKCHYHTYILALTHKKNKKAMRVFSKIFTDCYDVEANFNECIFDIGYSEALERFKKYF